MKAKPTPGDKDRRTLPYNTDAERALIGAVLLNNDAFRKVTNQIKDFGPACFMEDVHRQIWEPIATLIETGRLATPIILKEYLGDGDLGNGSTVMQYLARLVAEATSVINAPDYARTIRDLWLRRRIIAAASTILDTAYEAPVEMTAERIFAETERVLEELRPALTKEHSGFRDFGSIGSNNVHEAYINGNGFVGLSTGFPRLDEKIGGLQGGDLIILAGRPAMGKTALATSIAINAAEQVLEKFNAGDRLGVVAMLSLEMKDEQIKNRVMCDKSGVAMWKVNRARQTKSEMEAYVLKERDTVSLPFMIDDSTGISIAQVKLKVRALQKRRGISLLVIDYLQLISAPTRNDNRNDEIRKVTTGLKELAKECGIPIIALSQLSRSVEGRPDRRPMLSDLRESGSIEQDADIVMFVYREDYYLGKQKPRNQGSDNFHAWERSMRKWRGIAEIIIGKNRQGADDTAELGFDGEFTRFTNEPAEREPEPDDAPPKEKKDKAAALPPKALILHGLLRNLTPTKGDIATDDQLKTTFEGQPSLKKGARLIALAEAQSAYGNNAMPGESEAKVISAFRDNFALLKSKGLAQVYGTKETAFYVWLPELCLKM